MPEIMVARESYATEVNGERHSIVKGVTRADSDHPVVKQNPEYWEPLAQTVHLRVPRSSAKRVEQATREPGEQRDADPAKPASARAKSGRSARAKSGRSARAKSGRSARAKSGR